MDLILWRHVEAADGVPDHARALTPRGARQAKQMAAWLRARLPADTRVLASPATRTRQTAEALGVPFETTAQLGVDTDVANVFAAAGWPDAAGTVLLVGHQPTLGRIAALLLSGEEQDWSVKKGGVWWITRRVRNRHAQTLLRAVVNPDLLDKDD